MCIVEQNRKSLSWLSECQTGGKSTNPPVCKRRILSVGWEILNFSNLLYCRKTNCDSNYIPYLYYDFGGVLCCINLWLQSPPLYNLYNSQTLHYSARTLLFINFWFKHILFFVTNIIYFYYFCIVFLDELYKNEMNSDNKHVK